MLHAATDARGTAVVLLGVSDFMLMATSLDFGSIAVGITGVGGAIIGLWVYGIASVTKARIHAKIQAKKDWEEANKESLSAELAAIREETELARVQAQANAAEMAESLQHARDSLHNLRDEATVEQLRLREEIARLTRELQETRAELHGTREDYHRLLALWQAADERTRSNQDRIGKLETDGGLAQGSAIGTT